MEVSVISIIGTICFGLAVLHTFLVKKFQHLALKFREGSVPENLFHLLGEVEIIFGLWSGLFLFVLSLTKGSEEALHYLDSCDFREPAFVFVIMVICSTRPIMQLTSQVIAFLSHLLPLKKGLAYFVVILTLGPILGSLVTEPAAMTLTAMLLLEHFFNPEALPKEFNSAVYKKFQYATLGLLFVSVSIGGTLTHFAAPPVLMVARRWNWDLMFMLKHFGWKAVLAILISTLIVVFRFKGVLSKVVIKDNLKDSLKVRSKDSKKHSSIVSMSEPKRVPHKDSSRESHSPERHKNSKKHSGSPLWVGVVHIGFLIAMVLSSHHMVVFVLLFLFFLGFARVTTEFQNELKIREGLLVGLFLGGLVILGGVQNWWLGPLVSGLGNISLYLGAMGLTAITDNAALTFLGAQVQNLTEAAKYFLVAGSVVGGGLTVIANAPNPIGFGILNESFGEEGISPWQLFLAAAVPTVVAAICFGVG